MAKCNGCGIKRKPKDMVTVCLPGKNKIKMYFLCESCYKKWVKDELKLEK